MVPPTASLPAACADCLTTTKLAQTGGLPQTVVPQQSPSKLFRSADGKIRVDSGNISVITDPASQKTIMLDHLKKEASLIHPPQALQMPSVALPNVAMPALAINPPTNPAKVEDLGKAMIEGHEVMGKRITFQPPAAPQLPGMPKIPGAPPLPQAPHVPLTTSEIWTSTKYQLPVLSRTRGSFGEQICHCKYTQAGEPHPSLFQVPPGYKTVVPPPLPKLPNLPR